MGMERARTGVELLLAEPEIVAWLGLERRRADSPTPRRADSPRARAADRPAGRQRAVPAVRSLGFGMAL
jgi:hypothetical protein